jgi:deferrochelatase/peroxidase EfeB
MVGRWASGAPIVLYPDGDPGEVGSNDFGYQNDDQSGLRSCPVGAHVRRANPRDSSESSPAEGLKTTLNHRILRRGRPYGLPYVDPPTRPGEEAAAERGLVFLCLNADIERQFEFVQHTWINNPYFGGHRGEVDPVVGARPAEGGAFTMPDEPVRRKVSGLPEFVTTRGGAYFFLPGVTALAFLSQLPG